MQSAEIPKIAGDVGWATLRPHSSANVKAPIQFATIAE